jgi:hypothetical protein
MEPIFHKGEDKKKIIEKWKQKKDKKTNRRIANDSVQHKKKC